MDKQKEVFREVPFVNLDLTKAFLILPDNGRHKVFQLEPMIGEMAMNYLQFMERNREPQ